MRHRKVTVEEAIGMVLAHDISDRPCTERNSNFVAAVRVPPRFPANQIYFFAIL